MIYMKKNQIKTVPNLDNQNESKKLPILIELQKQTTEVKVNKLKLMEPVRLEIKKDKNKKKFNKFFER